MAIRERSQESSSEAWEACLTTARWIALHSGMVIETGCEFRLTENGVGPVVKMFARAIDTDAETREPYVVHEESWHYPTDGYKTMEFLVLDLLYRLDRRLMATA